MNAHFIVTVYVAIDAICCQCLRPPKYKPKMTGNYQKSTPLAKLRLSLPPFFLVSKVYGFDQRYLAALARRGRLKAQKVGNTWITTPRDVEIYIRSRQKRGAYRKDI